MLEENPAANTGLTVAEGTYNDQAIQYVERRLIVQLATPDGELAAQDDVQAQVGQALAGLPPGTTVIRGPSHTGRLVVLLPDTDTVLSNLGAAESTAAIEYVEPDVVDRAQIVPNDPRFPQQWAPAAVNAPGAWDLQTGAANALIGIIDSGISMSADLLDHDDLRDAARITLGTDFVDGGTPRDLNGHGTHVAGIAAAAGGNGSGIAGMNWGSPVYICRTLDAGGNGSSADFADAVEEITDAAVARGLKAVINYSGGGADNITKKQACQYASDRGMLVIAATGNDSAGPVIWPAAYSTVIVGVVAVGSTDQGDQVSSFSNVGPETTVVAPGRNILSTLPTYSVSPTLPLNYGTLSGTSMATPLVTGLAALMWSRHPAYSNAKIKECLQESAVKLGAAAFDNTWGHGRVNARAALTCGDLPIPPSVLRCPPSVLRCPPSRLDACPSRITICVEPTRICPSRITICPSELPVLCPTTRAATCSLSVVRCPSVVDGCPSNLRCGPGQPDPVGPVQGIDLAGESSAGADWYYVDDNGDVHEV